MATAVKDVELSAEVPDTMLAQRHIEFLANYEKDFEYEYEMTEYLRLSGIYWSLTALDLLHAIERLDRADMIDYVKSCQTAEGGFSPAPRHDPSILYTLSAMQILCIYNKLTTVNVDAAVDYISRLQNDDGSFSGDRWGEVDTRFSFCAVATLALVGRLHHNCPIDIDNCVRYILSCMNFDGGFGSRPGAETHSGQVYCCLGALSILGRLQEVDADLLGWWLCERQLPSGGLNGRPEKLPDVCYSWWVVSSLTILGKLHWIDKRKLNNFILASQDVETGGIADRPGDVVDPFHTLFGICGLSLLGDRSLKPVNPVLCMPQYVVDRLDIKLQILPS